MAEEGDLLLHFIALTSRLDALEDFLMDFEKIAGSNDNVDSAGDGAENGGEESHGNDATTPKIIEPDPSDDGNLNSEARHPVRVKEKRHNRTRSASRRGWKYPNGPPVPQPNQEPLTLEQCLRVTERDLFKRHEYHRTSLAQKEIYTQYLKFLIETSCRLLFPPGPIPRKPAQCPTSFGIEFSRFLSDVNYEGNDNIRWIPHGVATPKIDSQRYENTGQPEQEADAGLGTKSVDREDLHARRIDASDTQVEGLTAEHQELRPIRNTAEDHGPKQAEADGRDTPQPESKSTPERTTSQDVTIGSDVPTVSAASGSSREGNDGGEGIAVTLSEITPISPAIPTEDPAFSGPEIRGPIPTGKRPSVLDSEQLDEESGLQGPEPKPRGVVSVPHRPKSRGPSSSVLPIPYQSNQERLWLKYHEMQLHFDAEIDEMDSRIKALQKHLIRVGGSVDADGVARAGTRTNPEEKVQSDVLNTKTTEIGGVWLQDVRRTVNALKEMVSGPRRTQRSDKPKTEQPAKSIILPPVTNSAEPSASMSVPGLPDMSKETPAVGRTSEGRTLNELPYEILSAILKYLDIQTQATLSVTCRSWHQIMTPMVWKQVCLDEGTDDMAGRHRVYKELERVATPSDGKEKGKPTPGFVSFWPMACLTAETSIPADNEADGAGSEDTKSKKDDACSKDDADWWKRGPPKPERKFPKIEGPDVIMTTRQRAISYSESLALMPITMGVLRALGNPKIATHVRALYVRIGSMQWPWDGDQGPALAGDLVRHLHGLRAQTMRQMLVLIKKAMRNLTRLEELTIKSHDTKITNAVLGVLGWSPKLSVLQLLEVDLKACQLSRGRGRGQAYEVLKRIVEDSQDSEEVKREQIRVIDRLHSENGWMHCPPPGAKADEDAERASAQKGKEKENGPPETPTALDVQGTGEHEDGSSPLMRSIGEQKDNALNISIAPTQENEECTNGTDTLPATSPPALNNGKGRDCATIATPTLTSTEWRQKLSQESMNSACWGPVEIAAYDAGSIQGSSIGGIIARPLRLTGKRRQPPARKHPNRGSYFYPSLAHLTLQGCENQGQIVKPITRSAIRATVALRRFLTRCPNLKTIAIRDYTIQAESLFDFGSPRRPVWWKSIFAQTLMEGIGGGFTGGPLFVNEMQYVVEVPFEEDLSGSGGGQQQQPPAPPPSSHLYTPAGGGASSSAGSASVAVVQTPEVPPPSEDAGAGIERRQLMETVWKRLRDNNNQLLTFPNLEYLNIDRGAFLRPELPYHWISSPGFEDFFLRHNKIQKLTWDGYILNRHLPPTNPSFLKTTHHLGQTLKTLILNHVDYHTTPSHQIPAAAAHLKAFSFPRLNAFLRLLKALEVVDIYVDLMPVSQMMGIARALKGKAITSLILGRAKGVLGPAEVDVLVECLPKAEEIIVSRWRPANFLYGDSDIRMDPPGFGEMVYEEDEEFATQEVVEEEGDGIWFSAGELATKLSHLPNLTTLSLNFTFPIPLSPPLPTSPNDIFNILCDEAYHPPAALLAAPPDSPQSVWAREYLNALRTTAEVFASTPELRKLESVSLGYFVHDCSSRGTVRFFRDKEGRPEKWESWRFPEFVWKVLDAHEVECVGASLKPEGETGEVKAEAKAEAEASGEKERAEEAETAEEE
ncbi:hypothetical protein FGG08_004274 [Glutinoglossum americanum]|uniref:F-box domain-containing protein n=1 Tax=Glutinoglossum americanum TaxID=1670608 RepID=A0A9P8I0X4_9PEZI|nr:hypothetical protein FGG08_004274 [Glutinoglossum americanum]